MNAWLVVTEAALGSSVQATSSQGLQCLAAGDSSEPPEALTAGTVDQAEDLQCAYSIEEADSLSKGPPAATSRMHPPPQHPETSQQDLQADSYREGSAPTATKHLETCQQDLQPDSHREGSASTAAKQKQGMETLDGASLHDGIGEASGHERHHAGEPRQQHSVQSVSSAEVLGMGMQWLQSAYKGWTAEGEATVLPVLPAAPESLHAVGSLLSGMQDAAHIVHVNILFLS